MIIKYAQHISIFIGAIALLSFEATLGIPLLFCFFSLQVLQRNENYLKIVMLIIVSFMLSASVGASMVFITILFLIAHISIYRIKERTTLSQLAVASILIATIVAQAKLQLTGLSVVYFVGIWLFALSREFRKKILYAR